MDHEWTVTIQRPGLPVLLACEACGEKIQLSEFASRAKLMAERCGALELAGDGIIAVLDRVPLTDDQRADLRPSVQLWQMVMGRDIQGLVDRFLAGKINQVEFIERLKGDIHIEQEGCTGGAQRVGKTS